jgi:hypothetical protein
MIPRVDILLVFRTRTRDGILFVMMQSFSICMMFSA